ncbi:MAG: GNAT family N-acetyltransferase [archaeon]|jgi:ribosomal protein S18 acetylase RimI-like enzyme
MTSIRPEELKKLHDDTEKQVIINYEQLIDNSLKHIDEMQKLFPHWKREHLIKKLKSTKEGKDLRFVAKVDGKIIAHIKLKHGKSIHSHIIQITSLIVDTKHRRKGIGIGLMQYSISKLIKPTTLVTLAVDSKNKKAINLYKKIGFEKYGLLKKGSKINNVFVDNYLMKKEIN